MNEEMKIYLQALLDHHYQEHCADPQCHDCATLNLMCCALRRIVFYERSFPRTMGAKAA
jgi:hypothetical protein